MSARALLSILTLSIGEAAATLLPADDQSVNDNQAVRLEQVTER